MTETYTIKRRLSWEHLGDIVVAIECDPQASDSVKRGLAALKAGADLAGANLAGAHLTGALIEGEPITRIFARVQREADPYTFMGVALASGGYKIAAGCRWFTDAEFRAHVEAEYPGTDKADETLAILDYIASRAKAMGVVG